MAKSRTSAPIPAIGQQFLGNPHLLGRPAGEITTIDDGKNDYQANPLAILDIVVPQKSSLAPF